MARKSRYESNRPSDSVLSAVNILRVGMYLRLSVESAEDFKDNSLGHQKERCMSFLRNHPEMLVCGTYIDNGYTGTDFSRDEFQRMIGDIRQGKLNCVIVKDLSRFGRNYIETDKYLNVLFPEWKVRFIAVDDSLDTKEPDEDNIIVPLKAIFHDYFARDISRKIKSSIDSKIEDQSFIPGSFVIPYGYLRDAENKTFQIDKEAAPVIQRIFKLRAAGQSFTQIAKTLNSRNIPSPGRLRYLRGQVSSETYANSCWSKDFIRKLTNNPVYIGHRVHGKWVKNSFSSAFRAAKPEEMSVISHAHKPIISEEMYQKVQKINQENAKKPNLQRKTPTRKTLADVLKSKTCCGDCGGKLTFSKSKGTGYTAECSRYIRSGQTRCACHYITTERISEIIRTQMSIQCSLTDIEKDTSHAVIAEKELELINEREQLERQKSLVEQKRCMLLEDYADGILNREEYDALREGYDREYDVLLGHSIAAESKISILIQKERRKKELVNLIRELSERPNEDYDLWNALLEKVLVYANRKQKTVEVFFRYRDVYADSMEG